MYDPCPGHHGLREKLGGSIKLGYRCDDHVLHATTIILVSGHLSWSGRYLIIYEVPTPGRAEKIVVPKKKQSCRKKKRGVPKKKVVPKKKSRAKKKKVVPKKKSRAEKKNVPKKKVVPKKKLCQRKLTS